MCDYILQLLNTFLWHNIAKKIRLVFADIPDFMFHGAISEYEKNRQVYLPASQSNGIGDLYKH